MAISFKELLKSVENPNKDGFEEGVGWKPHKSPEGGEDTVAFGHKLSKEEHRERFVALPNGTIVDFNERGLTDEEAEMLLEADIRKKRKVAERHWNEANEKDFNSLKTIHQNLLTEIAFNIGGLKSSGTGSFGWPKLAEGIVNDDPEKIKSELMRSFENPKTGKREKLVARVNKIKDYFDNPDLGSKVLTPDAPQPQAPQIEPTGFSDNLTEILKQRLQSEQRGSQTPSEARTEPEEQENRTDSLIDSLAAGLRKRKQAGEAKLKRTANEAKLEAEAKKEGYRPTPQDRLIDRLSKMEVIKSRTYDRSNLNKPTEKTQEGLAGGIDDSKDPIYGIF